MKKYFYPQLSAVCTIIAMCFLIIAEAEANSHLIWVALGIIILALILIMVNTY